MTKGRTLYAGTLITLVLLTGITVGLQAVTTGPAPPSAADGGGGSRPPATGSAIRLLPTACVRAVPAGWIASRRSTIRRSNQRIRQLTGSRPMTG